jgi:hypothetical protein
MLLRVSIEAMMQAMPIKGFKLAPSKGPLRGETLDAGVRLRASGVAWRLIAPDRARNADD